MLITEWLQVAIVVFYFKLMQKSLIYKVKLILILQSMKNVFRRS